MNRDRTLFVYVEGPADRRIVRYLAHALRLPKEAMEVVVCGGLPRLRKRIADLVDSPTAKHIALIDADEMGVWESTSFARERLDNPRIDVFCAVPTVEAWLFADDKLAVSEARSPHAKSMVERLPLPEMIPYPKQLANNVFPEGEDSGRYRFLKKINISYAAARSVTLRVFLESIASFFGVSVDHQSPALVPTQTRSVISTLLREVPSDKIVWKTSGGDDVNAYDLARNVLDGTELGLQYSTEILRVARDLVARRSRT